MNSAARLFNAMKMQAEMAGKGRAAPRMGLVSSYDPANYCAKVRIMPEDTETGWLPIGSEWVGNGWGMYAPPSIGDMVEVQFQEDSPEAGYIGKRIYNDSDRPLTVQSGEFWLVHNSGSLLKFHNDGTVQLVAAGTLTSSAPQWNHTGPVHITGDVEITGNETVSGYIKAAGDITDNYTTQARTIAGLRQVYNSHTHNENNVPGGPTASPNQQA